MTRQNSPSVGARITCIALVLALCLAITSSPALAWNTAAKYVVALSIHKNGQVRFTLSDASAPIGAAEFECKSSGSNRQWLIIAPCGSGDLQCLAAVNRMTSVLISAKLNSRRVHVQNDDCDVTEVALKP